MKLKDIIFVLLIILVSLLFFNKFLQTQYFVGYDSDFSKTVVPTLFVIKHSLVEEGKLPLWNRFAFGGTPFYGMPANFMFYPLVWLVVFFDNFVFFIHLFFFIHIFFAGVGFYFLLRELDLDERSCLVGSVLFIGSGGVSYPVFSAWLALFLALSFVPLIFLCVLRLCRTGNFNYALFISFLFFVQVLTGGMQFFLYTFLLVIFYLLYDAFFNKSFRNLFYIFMIVVFTFGLISLRYFDTMDYIKHTSRNQLVTKGLFPGEFNNISSLVDQVFFYKKWGVGFLGLIFAFLSLKYIRNKNVSFFFIIAVLSLLISLNVPIIYDLFYEIPNVKYHRGIDRVLFFWAFSLCILAGFGFDFLLKRFKNYSIINYTFFILIVLTVSSSLYWQFIPNDSKEYYNENLNNNQVLKYLAQQRNETIFRIHNGRTHGIDTTDWGYTTSLKLETLYGLEAGLWINRYFTFINYNINYQTKEMFLKLLGSLNTRYLITNELVNASGILLIGNFSEYSGFFGSMSYFDGPYLYYNSYSVPRFYVFPSNVLFLVSNFDDHIALLTMLLDGFDPRFFNLVYANNTNIVGDKLDYFDFIIVVDTQKFDEKINTSCLEKRNVIPDLCYDKNNFGSGDVNSLLNNLINMKNLSGFSVPVIKYSSDLVVLNVTGVDGFVFAGEKYSMFSGDWRALTDKGEKEIFYSDFISSSIFVSNETTLTFKYVPKHMNKGIIITIITIIIMITIFFINTKFKKPALH